MTQFLQATVYGLLQGGLYALVAVGFTLVWGIMNIVNISHGAFVITGAYVAWWLNTNASIDPYIGMIAAAALLFVVGYPIQRVLINRVVNAPIWMTLLLTFGLELVIVNVLLLAFTGNYRTVRVEYVSGALSVGDVRAPFSRLVGFGVAVVLTFALVAFMERTRAGLSIRATGMDRITARLMGINARHTYALTFAIAAALAGAAGAIISTVGTFSPAAAGRFTLLSFVIAVLGGLGNMRGALAGGIVLGLAEAWGGQYLSGTLVNAIAFGVLVVVLIIRPSGLFGRPFYEARVEA